MTELRHLFENSCGELCRVHALSAELPSPAVTAKLLAYVGHLSSWSDRVDLVAPAPLPALLERHILDSWMAWMLLWHRFNVSRETPLMDVGSGAGLPGLVFAILSPDSPVYLCEPREKRCLFLKEMVRELALSQVKIFQKNLDAIRPEECPRVGFAIARAVGNESEILPAGFKLLPPEGNFYLMVGEGWEWKHLGYAMCSESYYLPSDTRGRRLVNVSRETLSPSI